MDSSESGAGEWVKGKGEADYWEFSIGAAHMFESLPGMPKLAVNYIFSPEYWGEDGIYHHVDALVTIGLPGDFTLAFEAGYENVEGDKQTGYDSYWEIYYGEDGDDKGFDFVYYRVGLSRDLFGGINCDLSYHFGMSEDDYEYFAEDTTDDKLVLTVSYTF